MRIVAVGAVARGSGMLHFRLLDEFGLVGVAGDADVLDVGLREYDLSILRRSVTGCAAILIGKRRMHEPRHQFGLSRLVRVVALQAVRSSEGLTLVRLDQRFILDVMAIDAKRRDAFVEVLVELDLADFTDLMRGMAGVAAHVERGVAATFRGHVRPLRMTVKAQVLALLAGSRLEQLVLVVGLVGIVALDAIAHGGRMDRSLEC